MLNIYYKYNFIILKAVGFS